jgi:quercetin dioxygenase-like cupin family protein
LLGAPVTFLAVRRFILSDDNVASGEQESLEMGFIDTGKLKVVERLPGWRGRYFDSESMTFGHYEFDAGSSIHEHSHPNEEVWNIIEGRLEVRIGDEAQVAGPGAAALVPPNTLHCVKALTSGKAIVVDYPVRPDMRRSTERSTRRE